MFGFRGKPQITFEANSAGQLNSSDGLRYWTWGIGANQSQHSSRVAVTLFDVDNVGGNTGIEATGGTTGQGSNFEAKIPLNGLLAPSPINDNTTYFNAGILNVPGLTVGRGYGHRNNNISIGSRKYRIVINRPDLIESVLSPQFASSFGYQSTIDLWQFTKLLYWRDISSDVQTLRRFPPSLKQFYSSEASLNSIETPFPKNLEAFYLSTGTTILLNGTKFNDLLSEVQALKAIYIGSTSSTYPLAVNVAQNMGLASMDLSNSRFQTLEVVWIGGQTSLTSFGTINSSSLKVLGFEACTALSAQGTAFKSLLSSNINSLLCVHVRNSASFGLGSISDSDIPNNIVVWYTSNCGITTSFDLTTVRSTLKALYLGNSTLSTANNNRPTVVDITGATQAVIIDLTGCLIEDLELPVNTVCTTLSLFDNELDISTNPNLITQINAMTALTDLRLGNGSDLDNSGQNYGQTSTNQLGSSVDLSGLSNLTLLAINKCMTGSGTLTLFNGAKLIALIVSFNSDLTSIVNLSAHATTLQSLVAWRNTNLVFSISNSYTQLFAMRVSGTKVTTIDLSGTTRGTNKVTQIYENNDLTSLTLWPSGFGNHAAASNIRVDSNPNLATLSNDEFITFASLLTANNAFNANDCSLNRTFNFGINNFVPRSIGVSNNGMSQANVDATINNMYQNRTKWNGYTAAKSLNIAGTNSAPSGTYQAPAGFVLGVNDGTPASAKEQTYVLVNNYGWTITQN